MPTAKRKMVSLSEQTYQALKLLGMTGDSFDKVIAKRILSRNSRQSNKDEGVEIKS